MIEALNITALVGKAVLVFVLMVLVDISWARYTIAASERRKVSAGLWSMAIVMCGCFSTISYVNNHWMILPAIAGAYIGTVAGIKDEK